MGELLRGNKLEDYFATCIFDGSTVRFSFKMNKALLLVKLNQIDGKDIYSFSAAWHSRVSLRFEPNTQRTYYVWTEDLPKFNAMKTEKEQMEYLQTVRYNDVCIGMIYTSEILKILKPLIKRDILYTFNVKTSESTYDFWLTTDIDNVQLAIYSNSILGNSMSVCLELDHEFKHKVIKSFATKLEDLTNSLNDQKHLIVKKMDKYENAGAVAYQYHYSVFCIPENQEERRGVLLFNIYYATSNRNYSRVVVGQSTAARLNIHRKDSTLVSSVDSVKKFIEDFAEAIDDKDYIYVKEDLQNAINI